MLEKQEEVEQWDPDIPHIKDQLSIISKRLLSRMAEMGLTPRIIQCRSGLALNSVKTALLGKTCNVGTLAAVCAAMKWSLFDCFVDKSAPQEVLKAAVAEPSEPQTVAPISVQPASSILD